MIIVVAVSVDDVAIHKMIIILFIGVFERQLLILSFSLCLKRRGIILMCFFSYFTKCFISMSKYRAAIHARTINMIFILYASF